MGLELHGVDQLRLSGIFEYTQELLTHGRLFSGVLGFCYLGSDQFRCGIHEAALGVLFEELARGLQPAGRVAGCFDLLGFLQFIIRDLWLGAGGLLSLLLWVLLGLLLRVLLMIAHHRGCA